MKIQEIYNNYKEYITPTYERYPLIFVKGKGSKLIDIHGKEYLDLFPGWGVSILGHCHPAVMSAVRDQIGKLIHLPNNLYHISQTKLAKEIIFWSFEGKVFFCNSGAEANEAAVKFARIYGKGRYEIISFKDSFHGRTLACLALTGQKKYREGFEPLPEGFKIVEFNDLEAVKNSITDRTVAVMLELIQGEGGINVAKKEFVLGLEKLCKEKDLLLIVDEVQTGMGRTGEIFCYKNYQITPDIMTLAKGLGGGLPIGCVVVRKKISDILRPGMHASTFGGSPLVCKAALGVFKVIQKEKLITNCKRVGEYLFNRLEELKKKYDFIKEVRGMGLMLGIELNIEGKRIVEECLKRGLLINCTQERVLRFLPALNITKKQIDKAIKILDTVFAETKVR